MTDKATHALARALGWKAFLALLVVLAPIGAASPAASASGAEEAWEELVVDGLTVDHHRDDALYASRVLEIYRDRGPVIARSMGLPDLSPLRVVIAASNEEFERETSSGVPDWGVGCALPTRGVVVLKSPRTVSYPLQMETVVVHEMAHVAAGRVLGRVEVPQWFDEGIAMAIAGEWRLEESPSLASAAASGQLIRLSSIERGFPREREAAALAYAESFQAVRFLMERTGIADPGDLVRLIATEGDFDRALRAIYGSSRSDFERDLFEFFGRRFRRALILQGGGFLFAGAAVLFVIAMAVRTRKSRRRMRAWEEEERARTPSRPWRPRDSSWN